MFHKKDKIGWLDGEVQRLDSQFRLGEWKRVTKGEASVQRHIVRNRQLPKYLGGRTRKYKGLYNTS